VDNLNTDIMSETQQKVPSLNIYRLSAETACSQLISVNFHSCIFELMRSVGIKSLTFSVYTLYFSNSDRLEVKKYIYIYIYISNRMLCMYMGEHG
jgi:hypothetical protein